MRKGLTSGLSRRFSLHSSPRDVPPKAKETPTLFLSPEPALAGQREQSPLGLPC